MAGTEDTDALMLAYVDGELEASAARVFEARLAADADLRAEVEGLRAMKTLLAQDAAFGRESLVDAPPPHLVNAILQAEAIARPREIREAAALAHRPTLAARLSRWMLGGSALLAGAAALFFVVTSNERASVMESVMEKASPAPIAAAPLQEAKSAAPAAPKVGSADDGLLWRPDSVLESDSGKEAQTGRTAFNSGPAPAAEPTVPLVSSLTLEEPARDELRPYTVRGDGSGGFVAESSSSRARAAPAPGEAADAERERGVVSLTLGKDSAPAAPPPPPLKAVADAPAVASAGGMQGVPAPDVPGARARGEKREASMDPRRQLADRKAEQKAAAKTPLGKSKAAESAKKQAGAKADRGDGEAAGPFDLLQTQEAEMAFTTGMRELQGKRYLEALTAFQDASTLDRKRSLGVSPTVGQMRCYAGLKRLPDVARLAAQLRYADLKAPDVVDGLLLGADAAEKTGDALLAELLWTRLLEDPAHKADARRALARVTRPLRQQVDLDDAAVAPAAAKPAETPASESR